MLSRKLKITASLFILALAFAVAGQLVSASHTKTANQIFSPQLNGDALAFFNFQAAQLKDNLLAPAACVAPPSNLV